MQEDEDHKIIAVIATTHLDRHQQRFTKADLDEMAEESTEVNPTKWMYWNHETTLPPIGSFDHTKVQHREDGEYELITEGNIFGNQHYEIVPKSEIKDIKIDREEVDKIIGDALINPNGELVVRYDPINYSQESISPIIKSLNEIIPTSEEWFVRKSEVPHEVIWVLVAFAGGVLARFGERVSDLIVDKTWEFYQEFNSRFALLFELKPEIKPDIILNIPIANSITTVEAMIEEANKKTMAIAWRTLPVVYAIASHIINKYSEGHFAEMKFLFNADTEQWEINYFTIRATQKIILGPRYYQPDHPQHKRWEKALKQIRDLNNNKEAHS